jgi:hypothetical protein
MKGSIKIVGTNSTTKHLQNILFENCLLETKGKIHDLYLNDKKYFLDIKETYFHENFLLVFGMISDDTDFVGNIALEFYPNK